MKVIKTTLGIATLCILAGCSTSPQGDQKDGRLATTPQEHTTEIMKAEQEEQHMLAIENKAQDTHYRVKGRQPAIQRSNVAKTAPTVLYSAKISMAEGIAPFPTAPFNTESYTPVGEHGYLSARHNPLSTFSIDVDTGSYSNIRRFITNGSLPPIGAVRIEEMINYFSYAYPQPKNAPLTLITEIGPSPWNPEYKLIHIGVKARDLDKDKKKLPPSNLVFLIDVSGSMQHPNKLPLLKKAMCLLVDQLDQNDRVAIVVYAGSDHIVLEPTNCDNKKQIKNAINSLQPGGSTHGAQGILTAYELARRTMMPMGNNRVILASDGDFNVGITSRGELMQLIKKQKSSGIFLTTLGFGMGNYHDDTMEILADKGNGNYAYIDSLLEAKKVLVKELSGTMFTLAQDVKIQVEFNPEKIGAYRLIGYENRALADEDFNNDTKDAGEIGIGHSVTALYEIIPPGNELIPTVDPLRYQRVEAKTTKNQELLTVKLRYKPLHQKGSTLLTKSIMEHNDSQVETSADFRFAAAVASYGMLLKNSEHLSGFTYGDCLALAKSGRGRDNEGYRAEFIKLVETSELLQQAMVK